MWLKRVFPLLDLALQVAHFPNVYHSVSQMTTNHRYGSSRSVVQCFFFCSLASFELNDLFSICRNREMQYAIKWLWLAGCSSQPNAPVKQKVSDRGETHAHRKIVAACIQQHTCHPDQTVTLFCFRVHFLLLLVRKWEKKVNARLKGKFYSSLLGAFICLE